MSELSEVTYGDILDSGRKREWLAYAINGFETLYLSSTAERQTSAEEHELAQVAANALRKLYYATGEHAKGGDRRE